MSRYRLAKGAGSSYFFTVVAYRRQPILCDEAIRTALRTAIEKVRKAGRVSTLLCLPGNNHKSIRAVAARVEHLLEDLQI